jgi:putative alpha-1,2-mannosidase
MVGTLIRPVLAALLCALPLTAASAFASAAAVGTEANKLTEDSLVQPVDKSFPHVRYVDGYIGTAAWQGAEGGSSDDMGNTLPQIGVPFAHTPFSPQTRATEVKKNIIDDVIIEVYNIYVHITILFYY